MPSDTCKHCGSQIHADVVGIPKDKHVWADNTGGDVCDGDQVHEPTNPHLPDLDEAVLSLRPHLIDLKQSVDSGVPLHLVKEINNLNTRQFKQ